MPYKSKWKKNEYQRLWIIERRKKWFFKKSCKICGSTKKLDLDHINRKNKISHNVWSWNKKKQQSELKKCQVLCKSCHLLKTIKENKVKNVHNGISCVAYRKGCRCNKCRKAQEIYMKRWRKLH